jgi:hypothetical protein
MAIGRADYETRKANRIDRLKARAEKRERESQFAYEGSRKIADMIPFGQPILVGHHSEKRARRDAEKVRAGMDKSVRLSREADYYTRRAEAAESNDSISRDDPKCLEKLQEKVEAMEDGLADLREGKKLYRKAKTTEEKQAIRVALRMPNGSFRDGEEWSDYVTTNLAGNLRRVKLRLEQVKATARQVEKLETAGPVTIGDVEIRTEDNRTMLLFPGKPSEGIRIALKSHGFRWAPSSGAWQRLASNGAQHAAESIAKQIAEGAIK